MKLEPGTIYHSVYGAGWYNPIFFGVDFTLFM